MTSKRHILITGGLGYAGSSIARDLAATDKYRITLTTRRPEANWPALDLPNVNIVQNNLLDSQTLEKLMEEVDAVLHLAGPDEKAVIQNPLGSIDAALKNTHILLDSAMRAEVAHFIFFSTIHIYGSPLIGRITEATCPRPRHPYGILNRAAEDYVLRYRDISSMDAVVFRLSNAIGPPVHPDITRWSLLVNDLCRMAVEKGYLKLHSTGAQLRNFIPLADVFSAVEHFLHLSKASTKDGLFNLGGESCSILEMAKRVQKQASFLFKREIPLYKPEISQGNNQQESLDFCSDKLKEIGFSPRLEMDASIEDTLNFCRLHFKK